MSWRKRDKICWLLAEKRFFIANIHIIFKQPSSSLETEIYSIYPLGIRGKWSFRWTFLDDQNKLAYSVDLPQSLHRVTSFSRSQTRVMVNSSRGHRGCKYGQHVPVWMRLPTSWLSFETALKELLVSFSDDINRHGRFEGHVVAWRIELGCWRCSIPCFSRHWGPARRPRYKLFWIYALVVYVPHTPNLRT